MISFEDLFGSSPENVSVDRLQTLLDDIVDKYAQQNRKSPRELVRVVDNGMVRWMTSEEAESYLGEAEENQSQNLKRSIQLALRGDSDILSMELNVLLTLARGTLDKYRDSGLIPIGEINRTEPQLVRVARSLTYSLGELRDVEARMADTRKKNPVMDEFESKMGALLDMQRQGKTQDALPLARELANLKPKYVRISKCLQGDSNKGHHVRLDLQHHKKTILSWHRYLAAQREGVLQEESQDLRKKIDNLKALIDRSLKEKTTVYEQQLGQRNAQFNENQSELNAIQREIAYLNMKEKETTSVIDQMEVQLGVKSEQPAQDAPPKPREDAPQPESEETVEEKKRLRMAIMSQQQRRS
ncbi:MAG: hypothetical protein GC154_15630 [bacterium]|nr:hypothetical protein [bacterium]